MSKKYDIIVIGSGPGGYVAAIRAAQLGKSVAVVERDALGGICLNWGCIPTKALLKSAEVHNQIKHAEDYGIKVDSYTADFNAIIDRSRGVANKMSKGIEFLLRKNKIDVLEGEGSLKRGKEVEVKDAEGNKLQYQAEHIIIATGARAKEIAGLEIDNEYIIGYKKALSLEELPKSMVVVGGGAIGVEFAYFYHSLGVDVTIVEYLEQGLLPREDKEISKALMRSFKKKGIKTYASTAVESVEKKEGKSVVQLFNRKKEKKESIETDIVLSAVGVVPNTENIGLEMLGVEKEGPYIKVDDFYQSNIPGIYAIGDVINTPALAHVASAEAITCVEKIAGLEVEKINYQQVPSNTYCHPEVASLGMTEEEAREAGYELKIGKFPYSASGKASASGENEGFVKLVFDAKYGELLGAHLIGDHVTEMIAELVVAAKLETTGHELIKSIHPHPTMSEAIMEAAAEAYDEVIHV
jgi:dihydrolipoamide dehydrogenase